MPLINVDELMDDPDFVTDTLVVLRTSEAVNAQGRNVVTKSPPLPFRGTIVPARARDLQRLPEGSSSSGVIVIITVERLTPGNPRTGKPADQIRWKDDLYVVSALDDYSEYGAGFVCAICTLQALNG